MTVALGCKLTMRRGVWNDAMNLDCEIEETLIGMRLQPNCKRQAPALSHSMTQRNALGKINAPTIFSSSGFEDPDSD